MKDLAALTLLFALGTFLVGLVVRVVLQVAARRQEAWASELRWAYRLHDRPRFYEAVRMAEPGPWELGEHPFTGPLDWPPKPVDLYDRERDETA